MRYEDVIAMAEAVGIPSAYDHFAEGESPAPPFLIYRFPGTKPFGADNTVYAEPWVLDFELYTKRKDPVLEEKVAEVLRENDMFWTKGEIWIGAQGLYEVLYEMEVLIDADYD